MDKFVKLGQDMVLLWSKYKVMYWAGIWNTLKLAFLATLIGCFIGLPFLIRRRTLCPSGSC